MIREKVANPPLDKKLFLRTMGDLFRHGVFLHPGFWPFLHGLPWWSCNFDAACGEKVTSAASISLDGLLPRGL
jgi:hypothetical protein